ncbi:hypothetical protein Ahy_A03g015559 [Arachis hypogaea]|uniref:SWIM-type domain-containing protein n=1 Tax=Arachis hypogaea TaxID=3818 RepID=A0A445E0V3_ARAHY|nr:hypothetical protein Ahy_A03g015559 [Arachis hypogaea]
MLFDYEVAEFEERWNNMVSELALQDNPWVCDLYARRHMWATAHIRGNFFGGFQTTSRCEGLHSMLGKFVRSQHNLKDFVERFFRCISQMRSREAFSDLQFTVGETVSSCTFTACSDIYSLFWSGDSTREWHISHYQNGSFFKCSCMRIETLEIPCDHIIAVFHHLDITEMPASVVLERWSKDARSRVRAFMEKGPFYWDSMVTCRNWMLNDLCRELCVLASTRVDDFVDVTGKLRNEIFQLKSKGVSPSGEGADPLVSSTLEDCVRDPQVLRHHKRCKFGVGRQPSTKGVKRCEICRAVGHNRLSCSQRHTHRQGHAAVGSGTQWRAVYEEADYSEYQDSWEECHFWSGHDASEKHEGESCEEDRYLDAREVSVTEIMIIQNVIPTYLRHQIALEGATHGHPVEDPKIAEVSLQQYTLALSHEKKHHSSQGLK